MDARYPNEWAVSRGSRFLNVLYGFPFDSSLFNTSDDGMPLIRIRDVISGTTSTTYGGTYQAQYVVHHGDVLIGMDGDFNMAAWKSSDALLNQRVCLVRDSQIALARYLLYALPFKLKTIHDEQDSTTVTHLSAYDLNKLTLNLPPIKEQRAIIMALDESTTRYDVAISTLTSQLDVLRRYRASLVHEAVTKGLDPSVPMKPSGVKWIGDIPCHWDIVRVKHVAAISSGATPSRSFPEYWDGNIPWVKTGELANKPIHDTEEKITASGFTSSALTMYEPGTILVAMYGQGKTRGMTGLLTIPATTNQACAALVVDKEKMLADYLWVALMAAYGPIRVAAAGGAQPNLSQDLISNFAITWPPKAEQDRIARLVTSRSESIDSIIDLKERQLDVLKRRRQSLIYEYVTGKRRVR